MEYTFDTFKNLATGDGFNYPIDVRVGQTYIGTVEVKPDGVAIRIIDTPKGKKHIPVHPKLTFKTQQIAAEKLHHLWKVYRSGVSTMR